MEQGHRRGMKRKERATTPDAVEALQALQGFDFGGGHCADDSDGLSLLAEPRELDSDSDVDREATIDPLLEIPMTSYNPDYAVEEMPQGVEEENEDVKDGSEESNNESLDTKKCNCKKSRCLKLYCECFSSGIFCEAACMCRECLNIVQYTTLVTETRQHIIDRSPNAFAPKVSGAGGHHKKGCHCKKSRCLKKYCECYQANVPCTDACRCENCMNNGPGGPRDESPQESLFDEGALPLMKRRTSQSQSQGKGSEGSANPSRFSQTQQQQTVMSQRAPFVPIAALRGLQSLALPAPSMQLALPAPSTQLRPPLTSQSIAPSLMDILEQGRKTLQDQQELTGSVRPCQSNPDSVSTQALSASLGCPTASDSLGKQYSRRHPKISPRVARQSRSRHRHFYEGVLTGKYSLNDFPPDAGLKKLQKIEQHNKNQSRMNSAQANSVFAQHVAQTQARKSREKKQIPEKKPAASGCVQPWRAPHQQLSPKEGQTYNIYRLAIQLKIAKLRELEQTSGISQSVELQALHNLAAKFQNDKPKVPDHDILPTQQTGQDQSNDRLVHTDLREARPIEPQENLREECEETGGSPSVEAPEANLQSEPQGNLVDRTCDLENQPPQPTGEPMTSAFAWEHPGHNRQPSPDSSDPMVHGQLLEGRGSFHPGLNYLPARTAQLEGQSSMPHSNLNPPFLKAETAQMGGSLCGMHEPQKQDLNAHHATILQPVSGLRIVKGSNTPQFRRISPGVDSRKLLGVSVQPMAQPLLYRNGHQQRSRTLVMGEPTRMQPPLSVGTMGSAAPATSRFTARQSSSLTHSSQVTTSATRDDASSPPVLGRPVQQTQEISSAQQNHVHSRRQTASMPNDQAGQMQSETEHAYFAHDVFPNRASPLRWGVVKRRKIIPHARAPSLPQVFYPKRTKPRQGHPVSKDSSALHVKQSTAARPQHALAAHTASLLTLHDDSNWRHMAAAQRTLATSPGSAGRGKENADPLSSPDSTHAGGKLRSLKEDEREAIGALLDLDTRFIH